MKENNHFLMLTIPGKPIAKKRPRFVRRGKFVATYNPQETEEGRFLWEITQQIGNNFKPLEHPIEVQMRFYMPIPKRTSKVKKRKMLCGEISHTKRPDLDNLEKFCLDVCHGLIFQDDAQIVRMTSEKLYGENPRTEIYISA